MPTSWCPTHRFSRQEMHLPLLPYARQRNDFSVKTRSLAGLTMRDCASEEPFPRAESSGISTDAHGVAGRPRTAKL
jgi:hypothetical protein